MAEKGHAPSEGCELFGVGYEDVFDTLRREYLKTGFKLGDSSEKFIVGAYGSGKTHFIRHLQEIARQSRCVTSEVQLNKNIEFTNYLTVFQEVVRKIRLPKVEERGIKNLLEGAARRIKRRIGTGDARQDKAALHKWASEVKQHPFEFPQYAEALGRALQALAAEDHASLDGLCRWLAGDFGNRSLCREFDLTFVEKGDQNRRAGQALLSLGQFVSLAGFRGTVLAFDEAEQGLDVDKRRFGKILSMLQSTINAVADLQGGALLIVYAFTPDLLFRFNEFPALEQRINSHRGFFEGNPYAPVIPLERNVPRDQELRAIATSLTELFFKWFEFTDPEARGQLESRCLTAAGDMAARSAAISARRETVKTICSILLQALPPTVQEEVVGNQDDDDDDDDY